MKLRPLRLILLLAAGALLMGVLQVFLPKPWSLPENPSGPVESDREVPFPHRLPAASPPAPLPGETILRGFADPARPATEDLTLLHRCLDTFLLAAKGMRDQPLSANGEIAAALRGEGRVKVAFLPRSHPIFNADGQLTDRWGTPFFFHPEQAGVIAIRSAGPDKVLWTADDLHREPNGTFRRGAALNPRSLK